jgi:hypothetical protein
MAEADERTSRILSRIRAMNDADRIRLADAQKRSAERGPLLAMSRLPAEQGMDQQGLRQRLLEAVSQVRGQLVTDALADLLGFNKLDEENGPQLDWNELSQNAAPWWEVQNLAVDAVEDALLGVLADVDPCMTPSNCSCTGS